jgi:glutamate synthase (NADPH/NADH) large chain/glutamate synthase (ferredoxin)
LRTGRDVVIAALLGAEAYGFGTATVVALGCAMARQCHLNSCPTGIATQRPELRAKFKGTPEQVIAYFTFVAEQVREILASLGARRMDEIIGRVELLEQIEHPETPRAQLLDLSGVLAAPVDRSAMRRRTAARNVRPGIVSLDEEILAHSAAKAPRVFTIGNHHLTVGARIAGDLARAHGGGSAGPAEPLRLRFRGSAGQSFGAFTLPRMHLHLEGEANDHVGKGLCGGEIVIRPFRAAAYVRAGASHVLLGNTALYGATSGRLFAAGAAGDRFAVRNSGAVAVIEGAGDHCCEYMTGGIVVVLGPVGRNLAAGMSNGLAYVLDEHGTLESHCNLDMVAVTNLNTMDERALRKLIQLHFHKTASARARLILAQWEDYRTLFRKVAPPVAVTEPAHLQPTGSRA